MRRTFVRGVMVCAMFGAIGCEADPDDSGVTLIEFQDGSGQAARQTDYPPPPYGLQPGSVIPNYRFFGYVDARASTAAMEPIALADFYNPHADDPSYHPASDADDDRLFPKGSRYGEGRAKPRALAIVVSSVWCDACKQESQALPTLYAKYAPCGGEFLVQLAEGPSAGEAASPEHLMSWTSQYQASYPSVIDPSHKLGAVTIDDDAPTNLIVDTRTMEIVDVVAGVPGLGFWGEFEDVLANPSCLVMP